MSVAVFLVTFNSCQFHQENIFEDSAANRLAANAEAVLTHLRNASNGWEMHYFPTNTQTGHVLLVRFDDDGMATMMGRNVTTNGRDAFGTGTYRVRTIQATVLSFDSYNPIIHAFSDPRTPPLGHGMQGDFEFVIISHSPDVIHLRGVKRNTHVEMRRLDENQDWSEHFNQVEEMRRYLLDANPALVLNIENERFSLSNGSNGIFNQLPFGSGGTPRRIPFVVTTVGITLAQNFVVGEGNSRQAVRRFVLNEERTQLIAADVSFDSRIQTAPAVDMFIENVENGARYLVLGNNESMSADVNDIRTTIENKLRHPYGLTLGFIGFANHRELGASLVIQARLGADAPEGFLGLDLRKEGDSEVSFTFTNIMDEHGNGQFFYDDGGASYFINMLEADIFTVDFQDDGFVPTTLRLQGKNNPDTWFYVFFR